MKETQRYWIGIGDIHGQPSAAARIPGVDRAGGIIVSGDLTNHGGRDEAAKVMAAVRAANPRVWAQIGNMDTDGAAAYLDDEGVNIHASAVELAENVGLVGVGASTPTPFNTPSEYPDAQLAEWLEEAYARAGQWEHLLLVAHDPPHGTGADQVSPGQHVGSKAVRAFIEKVQPEVCLTGHIHEARSLDAIGRTQVINPGTLGAGGYALIRLTDQGLQAELGQV